MENNLVMNNLLETAGEVAKSKWIYCHAVAMGVVVGILDKSVRSGIETAFEAVGWDIVWNTAAAVLLDKIC